MVTRSLFFKSGKLSDEQSGMKYKGIMPVTTEESLLRFIGGKPRKSQKLVIKTSEALQPRNKVKIARVQRAARKKTRVVEP